jgi:small subunit ribosomal protein S17
MMADVQPSEETEKTENVEEGQVEPETAAEPASGADEAPVAEAADDGDVAVEDKADEKAGESGGGEPVAAPVADESDHESLTPKQLRRLRRSRADGPPGPPRSVEERVAERSERRRVAAAARRRSRSRQREKRRGEQRQGTAPAEPQEARSKVRRGIVVSDRADKTITVRMERARRHPSYEKIVRRTNTLHVHDERNDAREGDVVRVLETRPLSRTKRWRLIEIVERAR